MPIIDVTLVLPKGEEISKTLAHALADALGTAMALPAGRLWVRLSRHAASLYAENGVPPHLTPHPVFVDVLHAHLPGGEALKIEAQAIAGAVAACTGRENDAIHVTYAPPGAGRVAFGGKLIE